MKICIIIPARYASTRFPGKPLAFLRSKDGSVRTLIQRSWEKAREVPGVHSIYIATDDDRIRYHAEGFGANVIMTSPNCKNGTERCAQAALMMDEKFDVYINFQGDAPMTPSWFVTELIEEMKQNKEAQVATPVLQCDYDTYQNFKIDRQSGRVGGTTAVFDADNNALYFSKEIIPYIDQDVENAHESCYHHVGVYAYRPSALLSYPQMGIGNLEKKEGLEQLRFLEHRTNIICVQVNSYGRVFWELNNQVDIKRIEEHI